MRQNITIIGILTGLFILGLWGQYCIDPDNLDTHLAQSIYQVLVLFTAGGEWTYIDNLPWQLDVARLLAPIAMITGVVLVLAKDVWVRIQNFFVRYSSNHVIVAGLSDKSWQFIQSCQLAYRVIVVEKDADNAYIQSARQMGVSVIIADIFETDAFKNLNLGEARHLITFTGNDGYNLELALKAREHIQRHHSHNHQLRIHLHIDDTRISQRLENYPKFFADYSLAEIHFFSIYDLSARILFRQYPPDQIAEAFALQRVHIALYEFDKMAEHILVESTRMCHFANASRLRFTIFDKDAASKENYLLNEHPRLPDICDIEFLPLEINSPQTVYELSEHLLTSISQHVVCCQTDEESLNLALILRASLLGRKASNAPIMVRMQQSSGLAQLLESNIGQPEIPDGLYPFGMLDQVLNIDNIINDRLDRVARAIHQDYLSRRRKEIDANPMLYSSLHEWDDLPEPERKSNRLQGDHLNVKLRAIRCCIDFGTDHGFEFSDQEAVLLAKMEHNRWKTNKMFEDWKAGPERIEGARVNPYAIEWDDMQEQDKTSEINTIKSLPVLLAKEGWHIQRELIVGVTGHRLNKLNIDDPQLTASIHDALMEIRKAFPDHRLIIMSPLAEGADRLVARVAINEFDMGLRVPLPLPYELYHTDFCSPESEHEFREMVGMAESYFEIPMRFGSMEQLATRVDESANELRNQQYALMGAYIVEHCDELVAIYDEEPATGTGGTAQIVSWRQNKCVDAMYRNVSDLNLRPEMKPPRILPPA